MNANLVAIIVGLLVLAGALWYAPRARRIVPFAFVIALFWTIAYRYEYVANNITLFGHINLYPLVLWTMGLTLATLVYDRMPKRHRFVAFVAVYWLFLWAVEAFGYYALGVRLNSNHADFFGTGVLHLPLYGQLFYIGITPVFAFFAHRYLKKEKIL